MLFTTQRIQLRLLTALLLVCTSSAFAAPVAFDQPAQPLQAAIEQLGKTGGVSITVDSQLVSGKQAPALKGTMEPGDALRQLLADSGLEAEAKGNSLVVLPASGEKSLNVVVVRAAAPKEGSAEVGYKPTTAKTTGPWGDKPILDTPYQISVIPQELIENTQTNSMDQLFTMSPLVQTNFSSKTNDNVAANIRGFYNGGLALDGIRTTNAYGVSVEELERVEIFNGLSGFLYGSPGFNGVSGTVNYVLKRPLYSPQYKLAIGNYGGSQYFGHVDLGGPIDEAGRFAYRLNAMTQDGESAIKGSHFKKNLLSGALDWKLADNVLLQFEAAHRELEVNGDNPTWSVAAGVKHPAAPDSSRLHAPSWTRNRVDTDRAGINLTWNINDALAFRSAALHKRDERWWSQLNPTLQANGTYTAGANRTLPWQLINQGGYAYLDATFKTGAIEHKLTTGFSGYYYESRNTELLSGAIFTSLPGLGFDGLRDVAQPTWTYTAGSFYTGSKAAARNWMIGDDVRFSERWQLLIGINQANVRSQYYASTGTHALTSQYDKAAWTPTVSLLFKPLPSVTTYATYMEALEPGAIVGTTYRNAGEILPPLISKQYEIGAKAEVDGILLSSAFFQINKGNQYSDDGTTTGTYVQDGREIHRGIEFIATGKLTDRLTVMGGVTWMNNRVEKTNDPSLRGKQPTNTAEKMAKIYAEYSVPGISGLVLTGGIYYTGPQYADTINTDKLPGYEVIDVGARYSTKIAGKETTFRLGITNLTDKDYWSNGYQLGDPRIVAFSVATQF